MHRNNGIGYKRDLKKRQQKRYWYFKETPGPLGYGKDAGYKIPVHAMVTVAGDIGYFGLGKLFMLSHNNEHRLAVLADTGGAFINNHYQLDYLGGYFKNWQDYVNTYRTFPDYFEARILLLRDWVVNTGKSPIDGLSAKLHCIVSWRAILARIDSKFATRSASNLEYKRRKSGSPPTKASV